MAHTPSPEIVLIAAVGENGVIGAQGDMPWHLSSDLKRFKRLTLGHPVIMGRKTYDSIGRPLPRRLNIVITRQHDWQMEGVTRVGSLDEALEVVSTNAKDQFSKTVMVIGGGEIYAAALPLAHRLEITQVHASPEGDTRFPEIDPATWEEIARETPERGPKDSADVTFLTYRRRG